LFLSVFVLTLGFYNVIAQQVNFDQSLTGTPKIYGSVSACLKTIGCYWVMVQEILISNDGDA